MESMAKFVGFCIVFFSVQNSYSGSFKKALCRAPCAAVVKQSLGLVHKTCVITAIPTDELPFFCCKFSLL